MLLKAKLEGDLADENELISLKKAAGRGWRNSVMERRIYGRLENCEKSGFFFENLRTILMERRIYGRSDQMVNDVVD